MDKLKNLWTTKKKFSGKGHVLGQAGPAAPSTRQSQSARDQRSKPPPTRQQPAQPLPEGRRLGIADDQRDDRVPSDSSQQATPVGPSTAPVSTSTGKSASYSVPSQQPDMDTAMQAAVADSSQELQEALLKLNAAGARVAAAVRVLLQVFDNIATKSVGPDGDPKYRRLRLQNPKVNEAIVETDGGIEMLQACGFDLVFEAADNGREEGFAVLPEWADLRPLQCALPLLQSMPWEPHSSILRMLSSASGSSPTQPPEPSQPPYPPAARPPPAPHSASQHPPAAAAASDPLPQPPSSEGLDTLRPSAPERLGRAWRPPNNHASTRDPAGSTGAQAAMPVDRQTQVLIPNEPNFQVADWVFERSPAELKRALQDAQRRREQSQVLMTKAMRDRQSSGARTASRTASIRVRMPEGLLLQGTFGAREPCSAISAWVAECLRNPTEEYELIIPRGGPVSSHKKSVREAGLVPSALLHFKHGQTAQRVPALTPELLATAQPAPS